MGAPKGNRNSAKDRVWAKALKDELAEYKDEKVKKGAALREIANVVIRQALHGSAAAYTEIANRLDGKPTEYVETTVTRRLAAELTDDELAYIASRSSERNSDPQIGPAEPGEIH
jgi:hypothetical protein